jgi:alpha-1,3-mannosyltransferase
MIGGLEKFVLSLAQEQVKEGHRVTVLTLNKSFIDQKTYPAEENHGEIKIYRIPFFGSKRYPLAFSAVNYLKDNEIIHIHGVDFFFDYLAWTKPFHRKKIILHTHGGFFHTKDYYWLKKIFFNTITRLSVKWCNKIIAISNNDVKLFEKVSKKIVLIENGVDVEKYQVAKNVNTGMMIYVGRIDTHKRIDNLIKAAVYLNQIGTDAKLNIIGPDWKGLKSGLLKLVPKEFESKINFLGPVDDETLIEEYSRAHLFVSASEYEGFGLSAIEALASGTPTVLNNIDSFNSFLENKPFGQIVNFGQVEKTASVIQKFIEIPKETFIELSDKARKFATKFSWGNTAVKIDNIYKEVKGID